MKTTLLKLTMTVALATVSTALSAQNVNIPDANFKAYLIGNTGINTNMDTEIQVSEATAFSGMINCASLSISNLTGIEAFVAITALNCNDNQLTSLNVSANPALSQLWCFNNQLTSLDVSGNTGLFQLRCYGNQLTSLNLGTNTNLFNVAAENNELTQLDVSGIPALYYLICNGNNLTELDVTSNPALVVLTAGSNQITEFDLSTNTALTQVNISMNPLELVNIANGNNTAITSFNAYGSGANQICIQVDDVTYSNTNWTNINSFTDFSLDCSTLSLSENQTLELGLFPNPANSVVSLSNLIVGSTLLITDMTGKTVLETIVSTSEMNLDVNNLNNGVYFVQLVNNSEITIAKKLVVNK